MPKFENSCNVKHCKEKLTNEELIRAIRFNIAAEYEAIQLYEQVIESTDNDVAKNVLRDIANEEREHAGELLKVLQIICPDEKKFYSDGEKEVNEIVKKLNQQNKE